MAQSLTNNVSAEMVAQEAAQKNSQMMKHLHLNVLEERLKLLDDEIKRREDSVVELKHIKGVYEFCYHRAKNMETQLKRIAMEKRKAAAVGDGQGEEVESNFNPDTTDCEACPICNAGEGTSFRAGGGYSPQGRCI